MVCNSPATAPGCTHRRLDLVLDKLALAMFSAHKVSQDCHLSKLLSFKLLTALTDRSRSRTSPGSSLLLRVCSNGVGRSVASQLLDHFLVKA
jgi:hypothetical protein